MSKYYIYYIFFSFLFSGIIQHSHITSVIENSPINIEVLINIEYDNIRKVTLFYQSNNQKNFLELNMKHTRDNFFSSTIPAEYVSNNGINYYILLELNDNTIFSFPTENPVDNPISILVKENKKRSKSKFKLTNKDVQILSPFPNSRVYKEDLLVSLSFFKLKNINFSKTKVYLNNRDITKNVTMYDNYFIYKPEFIIDGSYNVKVIFYDKYDRVLPEVKWSFTVISKNKLQGLSTLFSHTGKITNSYSINNNANENINLNNLNIDYRVNFDFLKIRNKFKISSQSNIYEQDKNRYLVSVKAPFVNLDLGDSYPTFNQYVLNGYRVRGLNLQLDSKFFDTKIVSGELARSTIGDPDDNGLVISNITDNQICIDSDGNYLEGITQDICCQDGCGEDLNQWVDDDSYTIDFSRDNYTFKRNILGVDLGFGNPNKFFFNFGFVKTKDNINTLDALSINMPNYLIQVPDNLVDSLININNIDNFTVNIDGCDTTYSILYNNLISNWNNWYTNYDYNLLSKNWIGNKPQDNLVLNSNLQFILDDENMMFNFGSSISLLNTDIWEPSLSIDDLDILFDDNEDGMIIEEIDLPTNIDLSAYEDIFQFSINQTPILPIDLLSNKTLFEKIITMPSLAFNFDLALKYLSHNIKIGLKQIGPEYNSLANPYLQTDLREQYISDKFRLFNNKLFVNCGFNRIEDGIEIDKIALSKTDKYDLSLNYYPGYNLPTYNLSMKLIKRDNGVDSLDVFTYQEPGHEGELGADEFGYITVSDTTNRRESTSSFQTNFSISYDFKYNGEHNLLFNISQSKKTDILYYTNIEFDTTYFSPRSLNQTMVVNFKSKWSNMYSSNISYSYNYYDYGNDLYFQDQKIRQIDLKGYSFRNNFFNTLQIGYSISWAEGFSKYFQLNPYFNIKLKFFKNILLDFNYQYRFRRMNNSQEYKSMFIFTKISYNF
tara:strand:- start:840 stop:3677 length:2838 start_codon:yes stop_codon:yes gene_type:complete